MNRMLTRGGVEFLAVFLGIGLSFNVEEWREDAQIKNRLKSDYLNIKKDLEKDLPYLIRITEEQSVAKEYTQKMIQMLHPDSLSWPNPSLLEAAYPRTLRFSWI